MVYIAEAFPHFACIRMGKQMGYITEYTLDIEAPNDALYREVEIWLERWSDDDWQNFVDHAKQFHIGIDQRTPPFSTDIIKNIWKADSWSAKWYSWKDDMTRLSFMFPKVLFTLSGHGEDQGDIWRAYFLGGKNQVEQARVVIDGFDPGKLRPLEI